MWVSLVDSWTSGPSRTCSIPTLSPYFFTSESFLHFLKHLSGNDAFMRHKRFHLHVLEKRQLSQKMVQRCENHQICRVDFWGKSPRFLSRPCTKMYTWGYMRGYPLLVAGLKGCSPSSSLWCMCGFCMV